MSSRTSFIVFESSDLNKHMRLIAQAASSKSWIKRGKLSQINGVLLRFVVISVSRVFAEEAPVPWVCGNAVSVQTPSVMIAAIAGSATLVDAATVMTVKVLKLVAHVISFLAKSAIPYLIAASVKRYCVQTVNCVQKAAAASCVKIVGISDTVINVLLGCV